MQQRPGFTLLTQSVVRFTLEFLAATKPATLRAIVLRPGLPRFHLFFFPFKNNLERSDFEMKTKYERRIENLDRENNAMKRQLSEADSVNRNVVATLEVR